MNEDRRDEIIDQLPERFEIREHDEELGGPGGTLEWWGETLGHEMDDKGRCLTCGRGGVCTFKAFYEAMVASVVREVDWLGRLSPVGVTVMPKGQEDLRGPVTWCEHSADRHDAEAGCVDCRCLHPEGHEDPDTIDRLRNDPFNLWGKSPSYRCRMTRHDACEPEGAEQGCTCSCGHQGPEEPLQRGWFTDPYGVQRLCVEQGPPGSTDFVPDPTPEEGSD